MGGSCKLTHKADSIICLNRMTLETRDPFKAGLIYERLSGIRVLNRYCSRLTLDSLEVVPVMKNLSD
jgi:hypothetical protein